MMKKLLVGTAALMALALPQAAFSKNIDAGSAGNAPAASQAQPKQATPNFHASASGTAASCGTGCTTVSGAFHSNQFSGSFTGLLRQTTNFAGCNGVQGTLNLMSGTDAALLGVTGTLCGASFTGDYTVTDGTGAYQENGAGWGTLHFTTAGAFTANADGTFYPTQARQTGVDYGSPQ
jgi:hypothetical protein